MHGRRINRHAGKNHLLRQRNANPSRKLGGAAAAGDQAKVGVRIAEFRGGRRIHKVTGEDNLQSASKG